MTEPTLTDEQNEALEEARGKAAAENVTPITSKAVVHVDGPSLDIEPGQRWWSKAQLAALATIGLGEDVPDEQKIAFLHLAQRTGLDPFARELYLIGRKTKVNGRETFKYSAQTGIDGFRTLAERTGEYGGKVGPYWCGADGAWVEVWLAEEPPKAARVGVKRDGFDVTWGIAVYREYVQTKAVWEQGRVVGEEPAAMWAKMPAHMLAKCAEALAIRQAFPRQAGGIYTDDEMGVADAAAERAAREEANAVRAQQRADLTRRPWDAEQASPALTAEGEVIEGEVVDAEVLPTVEELQGELAEQATILGTSTTALARRAVAMHRKNLDAFTAVELLTLIEANRPQVAAALASKVAETADAAAVPAETPAPEATDAVTEPAAVKRTRAPRKAADALSDDPAAVDPTKAHPYADFEGTCLICGAPQGDPLHT